VYESSVQDESGAAAGQGGPGAQGSSWQLGCKTAMLRSSLEVQLPGAWLGALGRNSLSPYSMQHPEEYFTPEVPWCEVSAKPPRPRAPHGSWVMAARNPWFCWDVPGSITTFPHQVIMLKCGFAFAGASCFLISICNILFLLLLAIWFPTKHCLVWKPSWRSKLSFGK